MNARIYDPILHTFLSPDALIADPSNPQNYNRYAYALNNPLMYVDYDGNEVITVAAVVTAAIIGAIIGTVSYVYISLYNGTAITWGGLAKSILVGAVSGAATCGIGGVIGSANTAICTATQTLTQTQITLMLSIPQAIMHGLAQGMIQGVSGGSFEQSFWTAAISSIAGSGFGMIPGKVGGYAKSPIGQSLFSAVAGGVTNRLQGGNFWEGAAIGLMVGLLNHSGNKLYPAIERMMGKKTTVAGIYGAGGDDTEGNPDLKRIVENEGGTMFTSSWGGGDDEIIAYIKAGFEKGNRIKVYGYSRGGAAAVRIANTLGEMNIHIHEMILFDPVSLYGGGDFVFKYPNVMKVTNYYQRNPVDGVAWWADNPYTGSPVRGNFQWPEIKNFNYTGHYYRGTPVGHLNIINYVRGK